MRPVHLGNSTQTSSTTPPRQSRTSAVDCDDPESPCRQHHRHGVIGPISPVRLQCRIDRLLRHAVVYHKRHVLPKEAQDVAPIRPDPNLRILCLGLPMTSATIPQTAQRHLLPKAIHSQPMPSGTVNCIGRQIVVSRGTRSHQIVTRYLGYQCLMPSLDPVDCTTCL
jgi:hypothetical protein